MNDPLIAALKAGSPVAYRQFVNDHLKQVINICYRFIDNRAEAEDLAQETFIEVYESIGKFRGDSSISTWVYRIAVRKSIDYCRRKNAQKRKGLLTGLLRLGDSGVDNLASTQFDLEKEMEESQRRKMLFGALASLPKNQQTAFLLSKYDDLSYEKIAEIMQVTVSAVNALMHRAKSNLQNRLRRVLTEDG